MLQRLKHTLSSLPRYFIGSLIFRFVGGVAHARFRGVAVGNGCRIYIREFGTEPFLIAIGDNVTIASGVKIITHDGSTALVRNEAGRRYLYYAKVTIGDDAFIGVNAIILPGITIGSKVIIGAGAVVTRDIPDNSVAVGNPARVIGSFDLYETRVINTFVNESELDSALPYEKRINEAISLKNNNFPNRNK